MPLILFSGLDDEYDASLGVPVIVFHTAPDWSGLIGFGLANSIAPHLGSALILQAQAVVGRWG